MAAPRRSFARGLDLAVSLGGDGTMLRTVDLVAAEGVPVMGVNVGQLGYLTEVEPPGLRMALKRFLAGSYEIEERMLLRVTVDAPGFEAFADSPGRQPATMRHTSDGARSSRSTRPCWRRPRWGTRCAWVSASTVRRSPRTLQTA